MQNYASVGTTSINYSENSMSNLVQPPDGFRWKRKAVRARILTGIITIAFTALIIVLVVTFELKLHCPILPKKSQVANESIIKFLFASDFHLDLYFDASVASKPGFCRKHGNTTKAAFEAPYGRIKCDSPELLVNSSITALKNEARKQAAEFLLFTGDMSCHKLDRGFPNGSTSQRVFETISRGNQLILESFSDIPVFPVIGNNDLPGHYVLPNSTSTWYQDVLKLWAPLITCSRCPSSVQHPTTMKILEKSFLEGGYYNASIAGGNMTLLVLNTMYFNVYSSINTTFIQNKAKSHIQWIEDQLKIAKGSGRKVILSSHIPVGIDSYNGKPFWLRPYTEAYVHLVRDKYQDIVAGQLYAHLHKDDFRLQVSKNEEMASFILLAPSVSPVYDNNPSFRVVSISPQQQTLVDYEQYYLDLVLATEFNEPVWRLQYKFNEKYPSSRPLIDGKRIDQLNQNLINQTGSDMVWKEYIFSRQVLYQPDHYNRFQLYCAMRYVFQEDFKQCIAKYKVTGG